MASGGRRLRAAEIIQIVNDKQYHYKCILTYLATDGIAIQGIGIAGESTSSLSQALLKETV